MVRWKGVNCRGRDSEEKVAGAFKVKVETGTLSEAYDLEHDAESATSQEGFLAIAKLKPKKTSLPAFTLRWDHKDSHLNVDIGGVSERERKWFKKSQKGYKGHMSERSVYEGRSFDVEIAIPSMTVFAGRVSFNLALDNSCVARIGVRAECEITVTPPNKG